MKILYAGKGIRARRCLEELVRHGEKIAAVVVPPQADDTVLKSSAAALGLKVLQPANINAPETLDLVKGLSPDLIILAGYTQIVKKGLIDIPKYGCLNLHGGRLPQYRGVAPINWSIINGEPIGGVSIIFVDEGIDTGYIVAQKEFEIKLEDTAKTILDKTLEIFPPLLIEVIKKLKENRLERVKQDNSQAVYYCRRYPKDGLIKFVEMSAKNVYDLIRGLVHPYPGAFTFYRDKKMFVWAAELIEKNIHGIPGRVCLKEKNGVIVMCRDKGILIKKVQLEEGPETEAGELIRKLGEDLG